MTNANIQNRLCLFVFWFGFFGIFGCSGSNGSAPSDAGTDMIEADASPSRKGFRGEPPASVSCDPSNSVEGEKLSSVVFSSFSISGEIHGCGVTGEDSIRCWGNETSGQKSEAPGGAFTQVSLMWDQSCGISSAGHANCWGGPYIGNSTTPPEGPTFSQIALTEEFGCGINKSNGSVECWWADSTLDPPFNLDQRVPEGKATQIDGHRGLMCGILTSSQNGTNLKCWGERVEDGEAIPDSGDFIDLAIGERIGCALRSDGSVNCWKSEWQDWTPAPSEEFVELEGSRYNVCGITQSGDVNCWGREGLSNRLNSQTPDGCIDQIRMGPGIACYARPDGKVACWGNDAVPHFQFP